MRIFPHIEIATGPVELFASLAFPFIISCCTAMALEAIYFALRLNPTFTKRGCAVHVPILLLAGLVGFFVGMNVEVQYPPTRFAPGYSRFKFNKVRVGDTTESAVSRLGEPLEISVADDPNDTEELYIYSLPADPSDRWTEYWQRWIIVDTKSGTVFKVISNLYW